MADPEDWDTKYLKELKYHYVRDVINYMFRQSDNKFSRLYSLLALAKLFDNTNIEKYYDLKEVSNKASVFGFEGTDKLVEYGINSCIETGLVEYDINNGYRLNRRFAQFVLDETKGTQGISATIKTFKAKN